MGYPQFGKVKTIVLPIGPLQNYSYEEYKKLYGIDLKDIFVIKDEYIVPKDSNTLILFKVNTEELAYPAYYTLYGLDKLETANYVAGSSNAKFIINIGGSIGAGFQIDSNAPLTIENIVAVLYEI